MATETDGHLPMDRAHPDALQLGEPVAYRLKMEPHEPARYRAALATGARLTADGQVGLDLVVFAASDNDVIPSVYHVVGALPGGAPGEWTRELPVVWAPLLLAEEPEDATPDATTQADPYGVGTPEDADTETPGSVAPPAVPTAEPSAEPAGLVHPAGQDGAPTTADASADGLAEGTPAPDSPPSAEAS